MKNPILPLMAILMLALPGPVMAQDAPVPTPAGSALTPVFGIQPNPPAADGYFAVTLEPGASAGLVARVMTVGSMPLTLRAYATNAISLANGGFGAGLDTDTLTSPATWVSFPPLTFDLGSTAFLDIPFTVTAPSDAAPGQYVAALIAQTDGPVAVEGSTFLNQVIRSSVPVVITVPGPVQASFALGEPLVTGDGLVAIPISNTGNVLVQPEGAITVSGTGGTVPIPVAMGPVFAGTATTIEFPLPFDLAPGTLEVSAILTDPATRATASLGPLSIAVSVAPVEPPSTFTVDAVTVTAVGDPVQYASIAIAVDNQGENITSGMVSLKVYRDDALVETYVVARNQAMPNGASSIETRYVPASGWQSGTYRFEIEITSVDSGGAATVIHTGPVPDTIVIP